MAYRFLFAFFLCCAAPAWATDSGPLPKLHYITERLQPYSYEENGRAQGLSVDLLRLMWREMATPEGEIEFMPWARAYETALAQPGTVLFSTVPIPEREPLFSWVGPIVATRTLIVGRNVHPDIAALDCISGKTIGVVRGYAVIDQLKGLQKDIELSLSNSIEANVQKLLSDRVDLIAIEESRFLQTIKRLKANPRDFKTAWAFEVAPHYAFNREIDAAVVARFQRALDAVKRTTAYRDLIKRHLD